MVNLCNHSCSFHCNQEKKCLCEEPEIITQEETETFYARQGCLKCDVWFNEPELKRK